MLRSKAINRSANAAPGVQHKDDVGVDLILAQGHVMTHATGIRARCQPVAARGQVLEGELTRFAGFDDEVEVSRSQETYQCSYGCARCSHDRACDRAARGKGDLLRRCLFIDRDRHASPRMLRLLDREDDVAAWNAIQ